MQLKPLQAASYNHLEPLGSLSSPGISSSSMSIKLTIGVVAAVEVAAGSHSRRIKRSSSISSSTRSSRE